MTEFWRSGGCPVPIRELANIAALFEQWGWDGLAIPEGHDSSPNPYIGCTLAASGTVRLKVGTDASVPSHEPQVLANAMATAQGISGGRAVYVLGRGANARRRLGRPELTDEEFETYVTRLQGYLAHEQVDLNGYSSSITALFTHDRSLNTVKPILEVVARDEESAAIGARHADGVSLDVGADVDRLRELVKAARGARAAAGYDPAEMSLSCSFPMAVGEGPELERVQEFIKDLGAAQIARGGVVNPDSVAIVGAATECAERLQQVVNLGFDRILLMTRNPGQDVLETNAARISHEVLPMVRR